jgi:hypothetical protein
MTKQISTSRITRESWLEAAIDVFRPKFAELEYPLPDVIHVGVGFPRGRAPENQVILAECLHSSQSADGHNHVYISPVVSDPIDALVSLVHELVHVALDNEDGHTGRFREIALALGFVGKMTETPPGDALGLELLMLAASLGDFPHAAVKMSTVVPVPAGSVPTPGVKGPRVTSGPVPQKNRYFLVVCDNSRCEGYGQYGGRFSRKWLKAAMPICGMCAHEMALTAPLPE